MFEKFIKSCIDIYHDKFKVLNTFFTSITFINLIKVCFSNKKYTLSIKTCPTQIRINIFLIEIWGLIGFIKIKVEQNQLPISFGNKILPISV